MCCKGGVKRRKQKGDWTACIVFGSGCVCVFVRGRERKVERVKKKKEKDEISLLARPPLTNSVSQWPSQELHPYLPLPPEVLINEETKRAEGVWQAFSSHPQVASEYNK